MKRLCFFLVLSAIAMADDTNLEEVLHAASNHFTGIFFSEVVKANSGKSVILSAYSVMTPLALLGLASEGPSHDELLTAIGLPNDNITKSVFSYVDTKLRSIKGVELKAASKIYIPLKYELNTEFADVSRNVFNCEVKNINFVKNEDAAKEINDWVEDQTNHRIKDLVNPESIDANTLAILVNALYFKGTWLTLFQKSSTRDKDFHINKEKIVKVPMMNVKSDYKYGESEILQSKILEMSYAGKQTSMMLILPNDIDGIQGLLEKLRDVSIIDQETRNLYESKVDVSIPKFKIESTTDLKEILQRMNVKKLFDEREARLNKLLKMYEKLYVTSATQKAFIEVNEEGSEAAAANQFGISYITSAVFTPREYTFYADHPFVFLLKERDNILFSGVYYA